MVLRGPAGASTTNIAFGGPNKSTLFVTDSTHENVLMHPFNTPGVVLHRSLHQQEIADNKQVLQ